MALSAEDIAALVEAIKPTIIEVANQSAADHVTKRNQAYDKKVEEKLSALASGSKTEPVTEESSEKQTLTQQVNQLRESQKRLQDELKAEREAGQRKSMRSNLENLLLKSGVSQSMVKAVSAQLIHDDQLVKMDAQGNAVFTSTQYDGPVSLEDGVSEWIRNEGKPFVQPAQTPGTGARTIRSIPNRDTTNQTFKTQAEADYALLDALKNM